MRISDWSSDVCSSDLDRLDAVAHENVGAAEAGRTGADDRDFLLCPAHFGHVRTPAPLERFVGDVLFNATDRYRAERSEERRVGQDCVCKCSSPWLPYPLKKQLSTLISTKHKLE